MLQSIDATMMATFLLRGRRMLDRAPKGVGDVWRDEGARRWRVVELWDLGNRVVVVAKPAEGVQ
jgi:hypothetical protein